MTFDLRQSMRNGGGPACLRLRVRADAGGARAHSRATSFSTMRSPRRSTPGSARNYRDRLAPEDLADPALLDESRRALDEVSQLLRLPSVYPFQQAPRS